MRPRNRNLNLYLCQLTSRNQNLEPLRDQIDTKNLRGLVVPKTPASSVEKGAASWGLSPRWPKGPPQGKGHMRVHHAQVTRTHAHSDDYYPRYITSA